MLKRNILLVEDDQQTAMITKFILNHAGYLVTEAKNGYDALDCLTKFHFDLVLLDLNLPMMNGFEFLERQQKMEEYKDIPVIILTVRNDEHSILKAKKLGTDQYLVKPPQKDLLLKKIQLLLGGEPQYRRLNIDPKSALSEASMTFHSRVVSVSEVGMVLHSPIPFEPGKLVTEIDCAVFQKLGVKQPKLSVCECNWDEKKGCFVVFLSFSELADRHIADIRQWVIEQSLKRSA